jgi:uncharacterized peroxidase-related enzyme
MIRLEKVRTGQGVKHKLMLKMAPLVVGAKAPDLMYILFYRPDFFGFPVGVLSDAILRSGSEWTVGERELFAAHVSRKNECRFCETAHTAVASRALGKDVVDAALRGEPGAVSNRAIAILHFLEKLTLEPDAVAPGDLEALRSAGIGDDAIADAVYVCFLFSTFNRLVFALGCEVMDAKQLDKVSKMLLEKGYDL